jgi:hypothetical protein
MSVDISKIEGSFESVPAAENDSEIYELAREAQVFSSNEIAKFAIASELRLQGLSIEAISRMLGISQEELLAEFDS